MAFTEKAPDWENAGIEPPASKRQSGWQVKDKPPAAWLNWFFNRAWKAIKELQDNSVEKVTGKGLSSNDFSTGEKEKLAGIAAEANKYVHPASHPASIIAQDASNRFVTDAEKVSWNGKANLTTTPQQTTADIIYYVRTDGNDNNNGLANTAAGAFKTIGKAISMVPKIVNHPVNINVAAGTYPEAVLFEGFSGGSLIAVNGAATAVATHVIGSLRVHECTLQVVVRGLTPTSTTSPAFTATRSNGLLIGGCVVNTASSQPGVFADSAFVQMADTSISNRSTAIQGHVNAVIFSQGTTGTGNTNAFVANYGSRISYSGAVPGATVLANTSEGGLVVPSSGVVNPWGDNTTNSRPIAYGYRLSVQPLSANVWTTVVMNNKIADNWSELNTANGVFTPQATGWYAFNAIVTLGAAVPNTIAHLRLLVSGVAEYRIDSRVNSSTVNLDISLAGSAMLYLRIGDTVVPQVFSTVASTVGESIGMTRIEAMRTA